MAKTVEDEKNKSLLTTTREQIEASYRARGLTVSLPNDLNYSLLRDHSVAEYQGRKVACLFFAEEKIGAEERSGWAIVKILPGNQFDLRDFKPSLHEAYGGCKVEFIKPATGNVAYCAVFNGNNLDWLRHDPS